MDDLTSQGELPGKTSFEKLRSQEYDALREELKINRQFVFERPLLIVGAAFAALTSIGKESMAFQALTLFFLLLLFFNLWFTFNRLSSNSRILGYLRVVHESDESVLRPGWENALSLHRKWLAANVEELRRIEKECDTLAMHDANRFYGGLFWFHLVMGGLAVVLGFPLLGGLDVSKPGLIREVELTRFDGHLILRENGVHDAKTQSALYT